MARGLVLLSTLTLLSACELTTEEDLLQTQSCKASFGEADACGGNLEGRWQYVSACAGQQILAPVLAVCRNIIIGEIAVDVTSGGLTLTSGNYDLDLEAAVTVSATIPQGCATLAGGCSSLKEWAEGLLPNGVATCSGSDPGACDCQLTVAIGAQSRGKLVIRGNVATIGSGQYYFCVEGDVARYRGVPGKSGGDEGVTYVMVRQ